MKAETDATRMAQSGKQKANRSADAPSLDSWIARITLLIYIAAGIAGGSLAAGFLARSERGLAGAAIGIIALTVVTEQVRSHRSPGGLPLGGFVGLAALSVVRGAHPFWALLATTAALVSWDLHHFCRRLLNVDRVRAPSLMISQHLTRLASVTGLGFGLGLATLLIQVRYGIGAVVALTLLSIVGLARAVSYLRRRSD